MNEVPKTANEAMTLDGVDIAMQWLMQNAAHSARRILARGCVAQDERAVRSLALTMLAAAAEFTAGGNVSRPAFKAYMETAITVLQNDSSDFAKRPSR